MRILLITLSVVLCCACSSSALFEENRDLENGIWLADSAQEFQFEINDRNKNYDIAVNLRNTLSYPYHNLYIKYDLFDENGKSVDSQMTEFNLFEQKTGKPLGSGIGDIYDHQLWLLSSYGFDEPGKYTLRLQQYMRLDSLEHILSIGLRVQSSVEDVENDTQE